MAGKGQSATSRPVNSAARSLVLRCASSCQLGGDALRDSGTVKLSFLSGIRFDGSVHAITYRRAILLAAQVGAQPAECTLVLRLLLTVPKRPALQRCHRFKRNSRPGADLSIRIASSLSTPADSLCTPRTAHRRDHAVSALQRRAGSVALRTLFFYRGQI